MADPKFTPGPWHQDEYENIKDAKGEKIRVNGVCLPHRSDAESVANSDLFTAAPDMYEALTGVLEAFGDDAHVIEWAGKESNQEGSKLGFFLTAPQITAILAALKKAGK